MTDNEIVKALECCNSTERGHCLNKCPYYNYSANCTQSMINDALDLIKKQKAEIELKTMDVESLTNERKALEEMFAEQKAELERKDIEIGILIRKKEALRDEVAELGAENQKLKREMSYISSPNTIGDRHEMGCW